MLTLTVRAPTAAARAMLLLTFCLIAFMFDEQRVDVIFMHVIVAEYTTSTTTVLDKDQ
jgi:hypothetical protein